MAATAQPCQATPPAANAELDFRRLLEALPAAAYTCDPQGLITAYNQRAVQAWGREPKLNDPKERYCGSFRMHTSDGEPVPHSECWMARCLKEGREYNGEEIVVERPDGSRRVVLAHAIPFYGDDGKLAGAVNVVVDITDRKRTEQQLQESQRELTESIRRKDEFLATLAHELRNPLAPIRTALEILRLARKDGRDLSSVSQMLERQVNHLVRLVDDLLDVSRITRDQIDLRREPIELSTIVHGAVETASPLIEAARHDLTIDLPSESLRLDADPVRLTQVLANLLNNAAKYTPEGGRIAIVGRRDGAEAVIAVRDTGMGIRADMLGRVFDLFMQGDLGYKRRQGGLGIGLTLTKRLVEMHGGTITARSEGEGRGAEFVVRLPLAVDGRAVRPAAATTPASLLPGCVLIVDDNRDAAESLGMLLTLLGVDATVVHDGPAALDAIRSARPSAVVLDIGMPDMDGYELARRIREQPEGQGMTLIALTGWGQQEDRERSRAAGIDHHVIKPVDCDALVGLLSTRSSEHAARA